MAVDKLIDSGQLDSDLEDIADAIRAKDGSSSQLAFPLGFVNAISNIPSGGGSGNLVSGTFKGTTSGVLSISLPYTGNGYPLAIAIYVKDGVDNANCDYYDVVQRYAHKSCIGVKSITSTSPDFTQANVTANIAQFLTCYKGSTSDATVYGTASGNSVMYGTGNPYGTSVLGSVVFSSSTNLKVYVTSSDRGFMKDIEYEYFVLYSS